MRREINNLELKTNSENSLAINLSQTRKTRLERRL